MSIHLRTMVILAIAGAVASYADDSARVAIETLTVSGQATLIAPGSSSAIKDASKIVVWLSPVDSLQPVRASTEGPRYRLLQHNKKFEPALLVVPVGSVVDFPNLDPWFHNVFSL